MPRFPRPLAAGVFGLFAAWALTVPVFEAPDEPAHWQYASYLRQHWSLPPYETGFEEGNSPPLAYVLFAPFAVDIGTPDTVVGWTPRHELWSLAPPRMFLNTGEAFEFYWPLRWARLLAALLSLGTVVFTWRAGLAARDPPTGLIAALVVGLLPMFAFRAGHVSNDALLACASAAATWGLVRLVREPFAWRSALGTAAAVGIAYLAKISAIALLPPLVVALLIAPPAIAWSGRARRLSALALTGLIVLPWTARNLWLHGDPFASEAMRHVVAHIVTDRPLLSAFFVTDFPRGLARSFVGVFGWVWVTMPGWFYRIYWLFFLVGGAGVLVGLRRRSIDRRLAAVLGLAGLAALAVVVRINLQFTQPQGRYLLPALPAFGVLIALGLRSIAPPVTRLASPLAVGLVLLAANLYALLGVVVPAYYPSPMRTLASGVRLVTPTNLTDLHMTEIGPEHFVVAGPRPSWLSPVGIDADAFGTFEVELTASAATPAQRGCVRYESVGHPLRANPAVCFDWLADGRPHVARVTLRGSPNWSGRVTHVRLDPFGDGGGVPGVPLRTRVPRLLP